MMTGSRVSIAISILLCAYSTVTAQAKKEEPFKWALDAIGAFQGPQGKPDAKSKDFGGKILYYFRVLEVISKDEMLLEGMRDIPSAVGSGKVTKARTETVHKPFVVKGQATKGIVDDAIITLDGKFRVIETKKHDGKTYFVITPHKEEKK